MGKTAHCGVYCRPRGYGKHADEWYHVHSNAKRKRYVKRRYPLYYVRPVAGEDERRSLDRAAKQS